VTPSRDGPTESGNFEDTLEANVVMGWEVEDKDEEERGSHQHLSTTYMSCHDSSYYVECSDRR